MNFSSISSFSLQATKKLTNIDFEDEDDLIEEDSDASDFDEDEDPDTIEVPGKFKLCFKIWQNWTY